jgi:hypothetical protein
MSHADSFILIASGNVTGFAVSLNFSARMLGGGGLPHKGLAFRSALFVSPKRQL